MVRTVQPITDATVLDCGHTPSAHESITTGYGIGVDGQTFCYACAADRDKTEMVKTGRAILYLVPTKTVNGFEVTNWPGSLRFPVSYAKTGRHNIGRTRVDAWFTGPDGKNWHAVQIGDTNEIAHCKRVK